MRFPFVTALYVYLVNIYGTGLSVFTGTSHLLLGQSSNTARTHLGSEFGRALGEFIGIASEWSAQGLTWWTLFGTLGRLSSI